MRSSLSLETPVNSWRCRSVEDRVRFSKIFLCIEVLTITTNCADFPSSLHIVSKLHKIHHMLIYSYTIVQYNRLYNVYYNKLMGVATETFPFYPRTSQGFCRISKA